MGAQVALHLLLMLTWVVLTDHISFSNLFAGYVVGAVILWFFGRNMMTGRFYLSRVVAAVKLIAVLVWEQIKSTFHVASLVLSPKLNIRPGIVTIPVEVTSDIEITALINMITLTPGTTPLDISEDRKRLYVHVINLTDPDLSSSNLLATKRRFEALIREVFR